MPSVSSISSAAGAATAGWSSPWPQGLEILEATTALEALQRVRAAHPDVLVLDRTPCCARWSSPAGAS
jgi:hypothetical protein